MTKDKKDRRLLRFREMAAARMERINLLWMDIEQGSAEAKAGLLRELHTHKGDASITGFRAVSALTHALEDAVLAMCGSGAPTLDDGDLFFETVDLLGEIGLLAPTDTSDAAHALIARLNERCAGDSSLDTGARDVVAESSPVEPSAEPTAQTSVAAETSVSSPHKGDSGIDTSVRVDATQLDRMREVMGELMMARSRLDASAGRVRKERESAARDRGSVADSKLIARLEKSLTGLESGLRDDLMHLSNLIEALDEVTSDFRMVRISELFDRYPRHVRELSRDLGKQVKLNIVGSEARLDREILNALEEPMLHLVRNAVDHGIESPEARRRSEKEECGMVSLSTRLLGNSIELCVADDGAGIDVANVREKARARGHLSDDQLDDKSVLQSLLVPGMTTRTITSEVSGRGIGLDVVDAAVQALNGTLEIRSTFGKGTSFLVTVPLSAAISMVLCFRVGRGVYALPANSIEAVVQKGEQTYVDALSGKAIRFREHTIPVVNLEEVLGESHQSGAGVCTRILIVNDGDKFVALHGGFDHQQREAVLKPAGGLLGQNRLVTAGCPTNNGEIALVLNIAAVRERHSPSERAVVSTERLTALVADDSPIIRDLLSDALRSFGLDVIEAEDGADALHQLEKHGSADILVTDLDMPKIDGIDLLKAIRLRPGPRMPAIVVSTRGSEEDKLAAISAGADAYIVKTSFTRDGLLALVSKYLQL